MSLTLIALITIGVLAFAAAAVAVIASQQRRQLLTRAVADGQSAGVPTIALKPVERESTALKWIAEQLPLDALGADEAGLRAKMIQAGYDAATAPLVFSLVRLGSLITFPTLAVMLAPRPSFLEFGFYIGLSLFIGWILPTGFVDRAARQRQERIRRSVPDALDLMVVCVEAGISLDASILRVARELRLAHPELAHELAVVNRKTNAGMPREEALRGLWQRTGVEEIRTLVSSMIQSEKWGTSIATVLRVAAETLRRKRRQTAEKKAAMAPLKMTFPLIFFVLPALFIVILAPAFLQVIEEFGKV